MVVMRVADDFVVGFEHREDAVRFLADRRARFAPFGLSLHPDKTRLIEFGRFAVSNWRARGAGKPETFNFLRIPAKLNADSEDAERGFRASRTRLGAERRVIAVS
jgi:hypothetical protein